MIETSQKCGRRRARTNRRRSQSTHPPFEKHNSYLSASIKKICDRKIAKTQTSRHRPKIHRLYVTLKIKTKCAHVVTVFYCHTIITFIFIWSHRINASIEFDINGSRNCPMNATYHRTHISFLVQLNENKNRKRVYLFSFIFVFWANNGKRWCMVFHIRRMMTP